MSDLYFCPERWEADSAITTNACVRKRVEGFSGDLTDAWQLSNQSGAWTAIISRIPIERGWLESGAEYRFCFWLNGGENAERTETCALEIYGDDWEDRLVFHLNRDRTRPLLEKNGWLLFAIPFIAPEASRALTFRFVAANAVCTIAGIPGMNMAACEGLISDERDLSRPQRHNIIYPGGYPAREKKVVLKARGRELTVSRKTIAVLAAAGAVLGAIAVAGLINRGKGSLKA